MLKCLEEHDYQIKGIAGTSAGGLFGSLYAAGTKIDDILPLVGEFFTKPNFRRASTDKPSLVGTSGIEASLRKLLGERNIENFPIAFAATAVSLKTGDEMVLDIPDYDGTPFYVVKGIRRGHHYCGAHSVFGDETRITATWTALDDRYVGVWVENGREWFFTFSLVSE